MKCRKCGIECVDAGFGHCKKCLAVPKFGITIREILQKVYNDGMLAGAKSTGERNYESVEGALADLSEIVMGELKGMLSAKDFNTLTDEDYARKTEERIGWNLAIKHIASLFTDNEQTKKGQSGSIISLKEKE